MTVREIKAQALEILQGGPWAPEPLDPRAPAVHLLKRDGHPIVSRNVGKFGQLQMEHRLIATDLTAEQIRVRRQEGLEMALYWHRHDAQKTWPGLVESIPCPFARDEAGEYLRAIILRSRVAVQM